MQVQNNHNLQAQNLNVAGNQENPVDPKNVVPADPNKLTSHNLEVSPLILTSTNLLTITIPVFSWGEGRCWDKKKKMSQFVPWTELVG